ncbi:MAG: thrombospondin type 3 repeat-containing protein [Ghiorsea sp.]
MKIKLKYLLTLSVMLGASGTQANAEQQALTNLSNYAGNITIQTSCTTCHSTIPSLNSFGTLFRNLGGTKGASYVLSTTAQSTLLNADTDNDGSLNLVELQAGTNPAGATSTTSNQTASVTGCTTSGLSMQALLFFGLFTSAFLFTRKKATNTFLGKDK